MQYKTIYNHIFAVIFFFTEFSREEAIIIKSILTDKGC